jgi:transcriptional regulator with XRE-family HTH domain
MELRLNAGLSPNDLAARAQLSGNTVRSAEAGRYISPRSQYAIAQVLRVDVLDVFPLDRQQRECHRVAA